MSLRRSVTNESGFLPDFMEESFRSWLLKGCGIVLMLAATAGMICLLTWSASEPSIYQAGSHAAHNWLGPTGALVADLFFQSLGLAAVLALIPPAVWGYELFSREHLHKPTMRLTVWPIGAFTLAGAFSALPTSSAWPLHQGFGGLLGDVFYGFAAQLFDTIYPHLSGPVIGTSFVLVGLSALSHALGFKLYDAKILFERKQGKAPKRQAERPLAGRRKGLIEQLRSTIAEVPPQSPAGQPASELVPEAQSATMMASAIEDFPNLVPAEPPISLATDPKDGDRPAEYPIDEDAHHIAKKFAPKQGKRAANPVSKMSNEAAIEVRNAHHEPQFAELDEPDEPNTPVRHAEGFQLPPLSLLKRARQSGNSPLDNRAMLRDKVRLLEEILSDFGVKGKIVNVRPGPVITRYELKLDRGVKASRVMGLAEDIARSMSTISARIAVVPGRNALGIELPNARRQNVYLRQVLEAETFAESDAALPLALGVGIDGAPIVADLCAMPHLLMAGTTGSGKSVGLNAIILSVLLRLKPEQCRFIMIDPKMLELSIYEGIPHLLSPVITDPNTAVKALNWVVREMEERYKQMSKLGVRNLKAFNEKVQAAHKSGQSLGRTVQTGYDRNTGEAIYEREELRLEAKPYIVVAIDEMADLMLTAGKDIEGAIQRLAQMARAAGIHLITATQRPSVDVITGTIKANLPTRIGYKVATATDSRTILGQHGAEQLLGAGDMLFTGGGGQFVRVHGAFVSETEIEKVVTFLRGQGEPQYVAGLANDLADVDEQDKQETSGSNALYDKAVAIVLRDKKVSTSYLQRRLSIGYNRAADLIERMEVDGLITVPNKAAKREILAKIT